MSSWDFFCDIAGRVAQKDPSSCLSVTGAAIQSDRVSEVRSKLLESLGGRPIKWRDATPGELQAVFGLLQRRNLPCMTLHIYRTQPGWDDFWSCARDFHVKLAGTTKQKAGFVKPGTIIRYWLFARGVARLIRLCLQRRGAGVTADVAGFLPLPLRLVFDRDIEDGESQTFFAEMFDHWGKATRLRSELTIAPAPSVEFRAEEDEPLLVLPDFVAGALQARLVASKGEPSRIGADLLRALGDMELSGSQLWEEKEEAFSEIYPLAFEGGCVS